MLDKSDTDTVRDWLLVALTVAETQGRTASDLAAWCGVSPQAVNGWKKTGRITKGNLERATLFFGSGPSFTPGGSSYAVREAVASSPAQRSGWPFPDIDRARFAALSPHQKIEIQGLVRDRIERFEAEAVRPAVTPARKATAGNRVRRPASAPARKTRSRT